MPLLDGGQRCLAVNHHVVMTGHNYDDGGMQQVPVEFLMRVVSNTRDLTPTRAAQTVGRHLDLEIRNACGV